MQEAIKLLQEVLKRDGWYYDDDGNLYCFYCYGSRYYDDDLDDYVGEHSDDCLIVRIRAFLEGQ